MSAPLTIQRPSNYIAPPIGDDLPVPLTTVPLPPADGNNLPFRPAPPLPTPLLSRPLPPADGSNLPFRTPDAMSAADAPPSEALAPKSRRDQAIDAYLAEKDRKITDHTKNPFLNILTGMGIRALQGFNNSQGTGARFQDRLFSALGAGAAGGVEGGVTGTVDENFMHDRRLAKLGGDVSTATAMEKQDQELQKGAYANAIAAQRPILDRRKVDAASLRADSDKTYKENQAALGVRKADELKIYQDAIVDLREKGADQNDKRIKLLENTLDERKRSNSEAEKDKDLDRDARIKVANIMSDTNLQTTGMRIKSAEGINAANNRVRISLQQNAQTFGREQTITKAVAVWASGYQKTNGKQPTPEETQQYKNYVEGNLNGAADDEQ